MADVFRDADLVGAFPSCRSVDMESADEPKLRFCNLELTCGSEAAMSMLTDLLNVVPRLCSDLEPSQAETASVLSRPPSYLHNVANVHASFCVAPPPSPS